LRRPWMSMESSPAAGVAGCTDALPAEDAELGVVEPPPCCLLPPPLLAPP